MRVQGRRLINFFLVALLVSGLWAIAVVAWAVHSRPNDPLGQQPGQRVVAERQRVSLEPEAPGGERTEQELPVLKVGVDGSVGDLTVLAEKCANESTSVRGTSSWRQLSPPSNVGVFDTPAPLSSYISAGCRLRQYINKVPQSVVDRVRELHERGVGVSTWQFQGSMTPVASDGVEGVTRTWVTEPFAIVWAGS